MPRTPAPRGAPRDASPVSSPSSEDGWQEVEATHEGPAQGAPHPGEADDEPQRRYHRIDAPMDLFVDGASHRVLDWSMTGFALPPNSVSFQEGHCFDCIASFHLQGARLSARFQGEVVRRTAQRIGCRFLSLEDDQIRLLRAVQSAHRAGHADVWDVVVGTAPGGGPAQGARPGSGGDDRSVGMPTPLALMRGRSPGGGAPAVGSNTAGDWRSRLIRGLVAIGLVLVLLATAWIALPRLFPDLESVAAGVVVPHQTLTAPQAGTVTEVLARPGDQAATQTVLMWLRPDADPNAAPLPVLSPCRCRVVSLAVAAGGRVDAGAPLARLTGGGGESEGKGEGDTVAGPTVAALFPPGAAQALAVGAAVDVKLAGLPQVLRGRVIATDREPAAFLSTLGPVSEGMRAVHVALDSAPVPLNNAQPARVRLRRGPLRALGL